MQRIQLLRNRYLLRNPDIPKSPINLKSLGGEGTQPINAQLIGLLLNMDEHL